MVAHEPRTFELIACLGRGGFGEVYRARMHRGSFSVDVALKLLRSDIDPRGQAAERLRDEARLLGRLRHRSIPRVFDFIKLEGRLALITELLDGADLGDCLRLPDPPRQRAVLDAVTQVAVGLDAAFSTLQPDGRPLGLVHRDLKPANLRVTSDGHVRILDLGIAWAAGLDRSAETQTGSILGSPGYMAPERFLGEPPAAASDVYSLACVLAEALMRRPLWHEVPLPMLAALAGDEQRFTTTQRARLLLPADTAPEVRESLLEALAWDPRQRPTASALALR